MLFKLSYLGTYICLNLLAIGVTHVQNNHLQTPLVIGLIIGVTASIIIIAIRSIHSAKSPVGIDSIFAMNSLSLLSCALYFIISTATTSQNNDEMNYLSMIVFSFLFQFTMIVNYFVISKLGKV